MTILVNACSASEGGAKEIVNNFISNYNSDETLILLAPDCYEIKNHKIIHHTISTTRIVTLLFSLLGVVFYCFKYKPRVVYSFTNLNLIFPLVRRVTYFHQLKIFSDNGLRFKIFRFFIRYFQNNVEFIFQTSFVKDCFVDTFGSISKKYHISWPGVYDSSSLTKASYSTICTKAFIPYGNILYSQKNFNFFLRNSKRLSDLNFETTVVSEGDVSNKTFRFLGYVSKSRMNEIYNDSDILLISSLSETVCLPIFEFAISGKPILILKANYVKGIEKYFSRNIIVAEENVYFEVLEKIKNNYMDYCLREDEIEGLSFIKPDWPQI
ncbi:glycosyltransferase [Vibrio splendidus]|uniref:glycosyltransferase n=1 Tax=Vibrio splendidus TaxID=29497 RepID=UPI000C837590|nr:glycosyltransferase family 1 protein [Vibrio splendidus]PMP47839.1 hypothetical protein BCS86_04970 [Vibrio splendidus]